jgi:hypothetical protein
MNLLTIPYSQSSTGTVRITAIQTVDIQLRHPGSFAAITDLATA